MAGIDTMTPYRDPRTAFGGAATARRPQIPVGEVTELFGDAAPRPTAAPVPPGAEPAAAARTARRGTISRAGIGAIGRAAGVGLAAAPEALDVGKVLANPGATGIDVATQAAEGTGRLASAGAGAMGGAKLGAMAAPFLGPLAPAGPVAGSILGGLVGYFSADKAIKGGRAAVGADPTSPVDRLVPAPAAAPVGIGDIPQASYSNEGRNAPAPAAAGTPAAGVITYDPKTKTYSGTDVKAGAEITGGAAGGRGTGRGTVNSIGTIGVEGYQQQLANIRGLGTPDSTVGQGPAGIGAATIGSDLRAKTDAMTPSDIARLAKGGTGGRAQAAAILQAQQQQAQAAAGDRMADLTARGQDIGLMGHQIGANSQRDIARLHSTTQKDVANITSDGRALAAEIRANPTVVVGGGAVPVDDGMGGVKYVTAPQRLVNRITGEEIGAKPQAAQAQALPPKDQLKAGQTYQTARGPAKWDGKQFMPVGQ